MATVEFHDEIGGTYLDEDPGGIFDSRCHYDRRYWHAWASSPDPQKRDCIPGVMDDFGNLVPVPSPGLPSQH